MNIIGLPEKLVEALTRYGLTGDNMESAIREIMEWVWEYSDKEDYSEDNFTQEEVDFFSIGFAQWYCYAEDAQVYKSQNYSAFQMLELYKSRPYLRTDSPTSN